MIKEFFKTYKVYLTPISPIHISSGEDYEPINFVLENEMLYVFDPAGPRLSPELRSDLLKRIESLNLAEINKFFIDHFELFKPYCTTVIPVDSQVEDRLKDVNSPNCFIQRTMHTMVDGIDCPYIPGSSIKGVLHSALLDNFNNGKSYSKCPVGQLDKHVFQGTMDRSPMSLIKVGDFMPTGHVKCRIQLAKRKKKENLELAKYRSVKQNMKKDIVPSNFEIIEKGQYRAFVGEISVPSSFDEIAEMKEIKRYPKDLWDLAKITHNFCFKSYENDNDTIWNKNQKDTWVNPLKDLLDKFSVNQEKYKSFLFRVGKNQGAEALTLIGQNNSKKSYTFFSAQEEDKNGNILDMPYGWLIAEIVDPEVDNTLLKDFCKKINENAKSYISDGASWH